MDKKIQAFRLGLFGGEGEIRTLEPCYRLRDFQSRALDQLGDFSLLLLASLYMIPQLQVKIKYYIEKSLKIFIYFLYFTR